MMREQNIITVGNLTKPSYAFQGSWAKVLHHWVAAFQTCQKGTVKAISLEN